jgi:ATP-dependent Lhr-like helicase
MCLITRENLDEWTSLAPAADLDGLSGPARDLYEPLNARGAMFPQELARSAKLLPAHVEIGLSELISRGFLTCDSFGALRWLMVPPSRRRGPLATVGRWSLIRRESSGAPDAAFVAKALLRRTGVVFRKTLTREKSPVPWRDVVRIFRTLEARGELRGGRFVAGFDGEQYALPEAVELLRAVRRRGDVRPLQVSAADPLNFRGILTPDERIPSIARRRVTVG